MRIKHQLVAVRIVVLYLFFAGILSAQAAEKPQADKNKSNSSSFVRLRRDDKNSPLPWNPPSSDTCPRIVQKTRLSWI